MPDQITPFGMTGMPGANFGGSSMPAPSPASSTSPAIGSNQGNPFLPQYPGGTSIAPLTSSMGGANVPKQGGDPLNIFQNSAQGFGWNQEHADNFVNQLTDLGFPQETAELLHNFMANGAGFNSNVANAMIQAMQPQVQRGQADILEQFSAQGLRNGSPAAIGFGDYMAQVHDNEQSVFAKLYEDSVQNYMKVLLGPASTQQGSSTFDDFLNATNSGSGTLLNLAKAGQANR